MRHGADPGVALAEVLGVSAGGLSGEGTPRADDALTVPHPEAALHTSGRLLIGRV